VWWQVFSGSREGAKPRKQQETMENSGKLPEMRKNSEKQLDLCRFLKSVVAVIRGITRRHEGLENSRK
jgi:hypothetical protein